MSFGQSLCKAEQTETSLTSARGSVRHFNSYDQINGGFEKKPIKEEPEDEDFSCKKRECIDRVCCGAK